MRCDAGDTGASAWRELSESRSLTVPSYSVCDGIRFLRRAVLYPDDPSAPPVSHVAEPTCVSSPAGFPRSAFTIGKERQMRRDRNWPWHVEDGADSREGPGRRARENEGERERGWWEYGVGRRSATWPCQPRVISRPIGHFLLPSYSAFFWLPVDSWRQKEPAIQLYPNCRKSQKLHKIPVRHTRHGGW